MKLINTTNFNIEDIKKLNVDNIKEYYSHYGSPKVHGDQGAHKISLKRSSKVSNSKWSKDKKSWSKYPEKTQHASIECAYLYSIPRELGKGNYANLGVFRGGSTACLAFGLKDNNLNGTVYAVDIFQKKSGNCDSTTKMHFENCKIDKYLKICKGYTFEWAKILANEGIKFKFIFIDADHYYESCKLDFDLWYPLLELNGIIAFHDVDFLSVDTFIAKEVHGRDDLCELDQFYAIRSFRKIK
jgi:predicted O-methyltransferase YrrM